MKRLPLCSSLVVYPIISSRTLSLLIGHRVGIKHVKHYHGIESTTADVAQSQNRLGVEALDLTGEESSKINDIDEESPEDVPSSSSFHTF